MALKEIHEPSKTAIWWACASITILCIALFASFLIVCLIDQPDLSSLSISDLNEGYQSKLLDVLLSKSNDSPSVCILEHSDHQDISHIRNVISDLYKLDNDHVITFVNNENINNNKDPDDVHVLLAPINSVLSHHAYFEALVDDSLSIDYHNHSGNQEPIRTMSKNLIIFITAPKGDSRVDELSTRFKHRLLPSISLY